MKKQVEGTILTKNLYEEKTDSIVFDLQLGTSSKLQTTTSNVLQISVIAEFDENLYGPDLGLEAPLDGETIKKKLGATKHKGLKFEIVKVMSDAKPLYTDDTEELDYTSIGKVFILGNLVPYDLPFYQRLEYQVFALCIGLLLCLYFFRDTINELLTNVLRSNTTLHSRSSKAQKLELKRHGQENKREQDKAEREHEQSH